MRLRPTRSSSPTTQTSTFVSDPPGLLSRTRAALAEESAETWFGASPRRISCRGRPKWDRCRSSSSRCCTDGFCKQASNRASGHMVHSPQTQRSKGQAVGNRAIEHPRRVNQFHSLLPCALHICVRVLGSQAPSSHRTASHSDIHRHQRSTTGRCAGRLDFARTCSGRSRRE